MKPYLFILLSVYFLVFSSSCKETVFVVEEVPVEVIPDFEELNRSRDPHKRIYQIKKYDNKLIFQSERVHHQYTADGENTTLITGRETRYREVMNEELVVTYRDRMLYIESLDIDQRFSNNRCRVNLDSILPADIAVTDFGIAPTGSIGYLDKSNVLLLNCYRASDRRRAYLIMKFERQLNLFHTVEVVSYNVNVFDSPIQVDISRGDLYEVEGGFVMINRTQSEDVIHRINYDGSNEEVFEPAASGGISGFFEYNNQLYTWFKAFPDNNVVLYTSDQNGRNWTLAYTINSNINFRFLPVENELFALNLNNSQLFLLTDMSTSTISFEALDNEQFWNYQTITDLEKMDDYIYVSTLSGFYRRDWQEFLESRAIDN